MRRAANETRSSYDSQKGKKYTIKDWGTEAHKVGKGVVLEFGRLGRDITIEGLVLGIDMLSGIATLGLSDPTSNNGGRKRRRRRRC